MRKISDLSQASAGDIVGCCVLGSRVLAVAVAGAIGDWSAYIDAVEGLDHDKEIPRVMSTGNKLSQRIAVVLFPQLDPKKFRE